MSKLGTAARLFAGALVFLATVASPGWAAPAPGREMGQNAAQSAALLPIEAQADDQGWLLDLAPGGVAPAAPAAVTVDEASDRAYVGTVDGWVLAYDRRTLSESARVKAEHPASVLAVDSQGARLYVGGERYSDQTLHVSVFSLPALEPRGSVTIASQALLRQIFHDPQRDRLYALVSRPEPYVATGELILLDEGANPTGQVWQLGGMVVAAALDPQTGRVFTLAPDFESPAATVRAYSPDGMEVGAAQLGTRAVQMTVDSARRRVYAVATDNAAAGRLDVVDADSLGVRASVTVSRQPSALALDPQDGLVWLAATRSAPDFAPLLEVVDPAVPTTVAFVNFNRPVGTYNPQSMAVDAGVRRLWVANLDSSISVLDLDSHQPVGTLLTSEILSDLGVDEGSGRLFVLASNADQLYAIEPVGGGVIGRVAVGRYPTSMRVDGGTGRVYVLNQTARSLSVVDGRALVSVTELRLATPPSDAGWDVDPGLGRVFMWNNGKLVVASLETGQEIGRVDVSGITHQGAAVVVDRDTHKVYVLGYTNAIVDGGSLEVVGDLPGSPLSLTIDRVNHRGYAVNWCTAKSCGIRTYVYDLRDGTLIAQLEGVGEVKALNPSLGHLYFPAAPAHVVDAYSFERMRMDWRATDIAADPGRARVYLLGETGHTVRAVPDRYPRSAPSLREGLWAKIQIVWPHDGAPVSEANLANIGATIYEATSYNPVGVDFAGEVRLWRAVNNEPAVPLAVGVKRLAPWPVGSPPACAGASVPRWEFNDVDVSPARDPNNKVFFYLTVDGTRVATNVWGHAADARTYFPKQDVPVGTAPVDEAVDTRVQIVWPNDGAGGERPVSEARFANVGIFIYNHGAQTSVPATWNPVVRLYRSLNNGVEQMVGVGRKETASEGGLSWPRWVFDGVDVSQASDPANKYYFRAEVDGKTTYAGVWSHGADGRTFFPQQDIPVPGCRQGEGPET